MRIRVFSALALAAFALAIPGALPARAQNRLADRIALDQGLVEVRASAGSTVGDHVKLISKTAVDQSVSSFVEDLGADADGDIIAVPRGTGQRSAAGWITVKPPTISLRGNSTETAEIGVSVPKGTKPGGYFAAVTFDTETGRPVGDRLLHAILVRVDGAGAAPNARIVSIAMPGVSLSGHVAIQTIVENIGTMHAIGGGTIAITDEFGKRVALLKMPTIVVLPGIQRVVTVTLRSPPVAARLKAVASVDFGAGATNASTTGFVLIWWLAAGLVAVLLLFVVSLLRLAGVAGPKAAARRAARAPAPAPAGHATGPIPVGAPPKEAPKPGREKRKDRKKKEKAGELAAAASAPPVAKPPPVVRPATPAAPKPAPPPPLKPAAPPVVRPVTPPSIRPVEPAVFKPISPAPGKDDDAPAAPLTPIPVGLSREPDRSFWGEEDEESRFAPLEPLVLAPASLSESDEPEDADLQDDAAGEEEPLHAEIDEIEPLDAGLPPEDEAAEPDEAEPGLDEQAADDHEGDAAWPSAPPPAEPKPVRPARPVPVVRPTPAKPPASAEPPPPPTQPQIRPAMRIPRPIQVADLPPLREKSPLPQEPWGSAPPPGVTLERPGGKGSAMALRRAEVALRMITGKPGETGAILDAGLDLLYSVRNDREVVEHIEAEYDETRNRRRLGPLALALFAVDSRRAPAALLDAFATASKVVADRIRKAILACDPADIRPNRALIEALPPARRISLGL